ncbi:MAG: hypothetical protein CSA75_01305 [Sorangium cellulosum]|nr:MAG: hypothetical protein CSA75_01305 [Sorangium cellulosum]
MSEKKVKIDLKKRLGRVSKGNHASTATPGAVPPPAAGIAPPPGIVSGGIPAPPFAARPRKRSGPKIKKDEPFQAVAADETAPQPKEIKVEIDSTVVRDQKKGFLKVILAAAFAAIIGAGIGFAIGGLNARSNADTHAIADAKSLVEPISTAKTNIEDLQTKVAAATKTLYKEKKFPEKFSKELTQVDISFSAADLGGKALHRLKPALLRMLFDFARDAQELNARKDAVRRLFDARKTAIVALIEQGKNPVIGYSVFIQKDRKGNAVGTFAKVSVPFKFDEKKWPDKFKISTGKEDVEAERYKTGEPFVKQPRREGEKTQIFAVPLEPDGITKAFPPRLSQRIEEELKAMGALISGTTPGKVRPEDEKPGLLKLADEIIRELNAVGAKR